MNYLDLMYINNGTQLWKSMVKYLDGLNSTFYCPILFIEITSGVFMNAL